MMIRAPEIGAKFLIVEGSKKMPLLGTDLMKKFKIQVTCVDKLYDNLKSLQSLLDEFPELFDDNSCQPTKRLKM